MATPLTLPQAIVLLQPSIVQIAFVAEGLSDELAKRTGRTWFTGTLGTGFFVNDGGYAVTAVHVISRGQQQIGEIAAKEKRLVVGLAMPNTENMRANFVQVEFDVIAEDAANDVALIRLRRNPFAGEVNSGIQIGANAVALPVSVGRLVPSRPQEGEAIGVSGYPLNEAALVTTSGHVAASWPYVMIEKQRPGASTWSTRTEMADRYLVDAEVNPGNSGGPVYYVGNAGIIGVVRAVNLSSVVDEEGAPAVSEKGTLRYGVGLAQVVPARYVAALLNACGVPFVAAE